MSNTKMLIDATHPEETRVVVQRNGRVEEFDFESAARKLLRGNIYLAKVTRVEPSLQAAFVDYGGNRHGFLAFNEIHPDYYQIPVADRQALLDEEAAAEAELEAAADRRAEALARRGQRGGGSNDSGPESPGDDFGDLTPTDDNVGSSHIVDVEEDEHIEEIGGDEDGEETVQVAASVVRRTDDIRSEPAPETESEAASSGDDARSQDEAQSTEVEASASDHDHTDDAQHDESAVDADSNADDDEHEHEHAHEDTGDDSIASHDDAPAHGEMRSDSRPRQRRRPRTYKIQEVIKRRQIILVQVVKEERGNKGAALTTYLSLAGRYTVLMPNTARGGGISRKITNPQDRRRLKSIAQELEVPEGMGLIIRTAGAARTKQEIKRDFEYLLRLWESVRDLTLQSTAPSLVYEEGDLIKRSIRDLYNKDVEEIVVAGDAGHQEAADFMQMLMPSHAKNVVAYRDPTPLFTRYGVERQLNAMFQPQVTLRSGGYIVINQTEALVAIDVNSGKSTREFSIEETALATNLEAADEIARQLKLRDLAGLIVIDFIDMEEKRNNRAVERRLKDALRFDRARIQLGRISHFGLMEMSRQRLRTGVLEGSTSQCAHCQGTGIIRSTESVALAVLRGIEDVITAGANGPLIATTTSAVALYILNSKRPYIADMEIRHGHTITVLGSDRMQGANFTVERTAATHAPVRRAERAAVNMDWGFDGDNEPAYTASEIETTVEVYDEDENVGPERNGARNDGDEGGARRGRRRRRRGRGGRDRGDDRERFAYEANDDANAAANDDAQMDSDEAGAEIAGLEDQPSVDDGANAGHAEGNGSEERPNKRRRRGRRGGRRGRDRGRESEQTQSADDAEGFASESEQSDNNDDDGANDVAADDNGDKSPEYNGAAGDKEKAPKAPGRRPRRVWDVPSAANGDEEQPAAPAEKAAKAVPTPEPAREPEVVVTPEPTPSRRRHETGSSEPRIERVVVGPNAQSDVAETETASAPAQRKGWWQRKFGGE